MSPTKNLNVTHIKMPLKMLPFGKWPAKKSYQAGPYDTYTGLHRPILFPMRPVREKEFPHP